MKIGVIADDFTGASDIALTLAEGGLSVALFTGLPDAPAPDTLDVGVIALKSRTAPVEDAVSDSLLACDWLCAQGAEQIVFKICSTFDSTPDGNIGPVLDALGEKLDVKVVLVCPAFPENGRSVYKSRLFVGDVPLNESAMKNHPLTPMRDADLRRVLGAQSEWEISAVHQDVVHKGPNALLKALPNEGHVIVDAIHDSDLITIGKALKGSKLLCGGSGIALGLAENFGAQPAAPTWSPVMGPGVVLSGSCSPATRAQVFYYSKEAPSFEIKVEELLSGSQTAQNIADWVAEQAQPPLVFSTADPEAVRALQDIYGRQRVASAIEGLFQDLAGLVVQMGTRRIVVAGGETSGAVVEGLAPKHLQIGPRIAAGVPLLRATDPDVGLTLKSGNFGGPYFFSRALNLMAGR